MKVLRVDMAWCRFCRPDALQLVGVEAVLSSIVRGIGCGGAMFRRSATRTDEHSNRTFFRRKRDCVVKRRAAFNAWFHRLCGITHVGKKLLSDGFKDKSQIEKFIAIGFRK